MIQAYPSIYQLGHKAVLDILHSPVVVQEKIDGSQFNFGVYAWTTREGGESCEPELRCRSRGAELNLDAPEKMFAQAITVVRELYSAGGLVPGWTYRAEYLAKPKHNTLAYDRVPSNHLILFDVDRGDQDYLPIEQLTQLASNLGLEAVPTLRAGMIEDVQDVRALLDTVSVLGGQKIEGVVIKNYSMFGPDKKVLMAKFVSEAYKEVHRTEWKAGNPASGDIIDTLITRYRSPARWAKAAQHLREAGQLEDAPKDIGLLLKEAPEDLKREEQEAIRDFLFAWAWPRIRRGAMAGLAEWYKDQLLAKQFEEGGASPRPAHGD